jgi:hypothetical protein
MTPRVVQWATGNLVRAEPGTKTCLDLPIVTGRADANLRD